MAAAKWGRMARSYARFCAKDRRLSFRSQSRCVFAMSRQIGEQLSDIGLRFHELDTRLPSVGSPVEREGSWCGKGGKRTFAAEGFLTWRDFKAGIRRYRMPISDHAPMPVT